MAVLAIAAVGAVAGGAIGAGFGAVALGASIGWAVGSFVGQLAFGPDPPSNIGPRLQDLAVQSSAEGVGIPIVFGRARLAGNVIWAQPIRETRHEEEVGGKGMGGGGTQVSYTYSVSFAIGLCEGPIVGIRKIWADSKLIYNVGSDASTEVLAASEDRAKSIKMYTGSETQTADPTIQSFEGAANTPAYRGLAYLVFEDLELADFANHLPNITVEVLSAGTFNNLSTSYATPTTPVNGNAIANFVGDTTLLAISDASLVNIQIYAVFQNGTIIKGANLAVSPAATEQTVHGYSDRPGLITTSGSQVIKFYSLTEDGSAMSLFASVLVAAGGVKACVRNGDIYVLLTTPQLFYKQRLDGFEVPAVQLYGGGGGFFLEQFVVSHNYIYGLVSPTGPTHTIKVWDLNFGLVKSISFTPSPTLYYGVHGPRLGTDNDRFLYIVSGSSAADFIRIHRIDIGTGEYSYLGATLLDVNYQNAYGGFGVRGNLLTVYAVEGDTIEFIRPSIVLEQNVALSTIVSALCVRSGLSAGDIDTAVLTDAVDGYVIPRPMTARAALEQLRQAYFFDATESDGKVKFVKRGGASAATIASDELGAREYGTEAAEPIRITRAQELELPAEVHVQYWDMDNDYLPGSQSARRLTTASRNQISIDLPLALSSAKAAQIADVLIRNSWIERHRFAFALTRKYAQLDPADTVTVPTAQGLALCRLTRTDYGASGVLACEALADDTVLYSSAVAGNDSSVNQPQTLYLTGPTRLELLDIPMLRVLDNDPGFYVAVSGYLGGWKGAVLYKSVDSGITWNTVVGLLVEAAMGYTTDALGAWSGGNVWDKGNTVNVKVTTSGVTLSSTTELAVLAGGNTIAIGAHGRWEIMQFMTATLQGDGTYSLSNLLRGRLGTEWAAGTHQIADSFVLLSSATLRRAQAENSAEIGLQRLFRGVSIGGSLEGTQSRSFTNTAVGLECYSPVNIGGGRNGASDIIINWERRSRIGGEWRDYVDASLGETSENYEVEIWTTDFATLKRTISGLAAKTTTYTSAQQVTDFGSNQSSVGVKVYQLSGTVGRGYPGQALV